MLFAVVVGLSKNGKGRSPCHGRLSVLLCRVLLLGDGLLLGHKLKENRVCSLIPARIHVLSLNAKLAYGVITIIIVRAWRDVPFLSSPSRKRKLRFAHSVVHAFVDACLELVKNSVVKDDKERYSV